MVSLYKVLQLIEAEWHICVSKLTTPCLDDGLSPCRRRVIIWTYARILLIGPLCTNFSEMYIFSFKKMNLEMSSAKSWPFCLELNVLREGWRWLHGYVWDWSTNYQVITCLLLQSWIFIYTLVHIFIITNCNKKKNRKNLSRFNIWHRRDHSIHYMINIFTCELFYSKRAFFFLLELTKLYDKKVMQLATKSLILKPIPVN